MFRLDGIAEKKGNCVSHASRQERSEKHLFWMLGGVKWSPIGRTFDSGVTSIQIFEVERAGMAMQFRLFLRPLIDLIFSPRNIT